jgi:hypothetical protein
MRVHARTCDTANEHIRFSKFLFARSPTDVYTMLQLHISYTVEAEVTMVMDAQRIRDAENRIEPIPPNGPLRAQTKN